MKNRGEIKYYCHAHDYGPDPGYSSEDCTDCEFTNDRTVEKCDKEIEALRAKLDIAVKNLKAMCTCGQTEGDIDPCQACATLAVITERSSSE